MRGNVKLASSVPCQQVRERLGEADAKALANFCAKKMPAKRAIKMFGEVT